MLSAVEPGIDGPLSWPDQRQRHAQDRQCEGNTRMRRQREGDPRFSARRHNSGDLNPLYQIGGPRSAQLALKLLF